MNEIEPITTEPRNADVLAGAWSVERHLSPLALFDPNRSAICAQYQLALIDDSSNEARAHILAARRHLQAAMHPEGIDAMLPVGFVASVRSVCVRLDELSRAWD